MDDYTAISGLENLYLEDSFVLGVHHDDRGLRFVVEAVLTQEHPDWHPPKPGEAHAYAVVQISFDEAPGVTWHDRTMRPIVGPDGEVDYGNIDSFTRDGTEYALAGEWGDVTIRSPYPPRISAHQARPGRRKPFE